VVLLSKLAATGGGHTVAATGDTEERMAAGTLRADQVHVWYVDLTRGPTADDARCLDAAERERAGRFRHDRHREQYLASHCAFRHLVAGYLGCPPDAVRIARECAHCGDPAHGKPAVAGPDGERRLEVNASHADGMGMVAVAWAPLVVGVDVERLRPGVDWAGVLRQISTDPAPDSDLAGFRQWTRVEAVTKAAGLGLAARPTLEPADAGQDWRAARIPGSAPTWQVRALPAPEGYAAALAADRVPAAGVEVSTWAGR
jgi:4'-phosphopantetheinyl transferase